MSIAAATTWTFLEADPRFDAAAPRDWREHIFDVEVADRFHAKQGRSIGRWTLGAGANEVVVYLKRHYDLPGVRPGRSPGREEFEHLAWARERGLPVPNALAAGERVGPGGRVQSFLAVEELAGMLALHEAIPLAAGRLDSAEFSAWKQSLAAELARLARHLHGLGAYHQDLYLCHFYILESDTLVAPASWAGRVVMIDFHRLTRRRLGAAWWRVKDLAQLKFSTIGVSGLDAADEANFWRAYTGGARAAWLARAVAWKAARYARHNGADGS